MVYEFNIYIFFLTENITYFYSQTADTIIENMEFDCLCVYVCVLPTLPTYVFVR